MAAIIDWALVRSLPVFSGMDDAAFEQLMGLAMPRAVPKGSAVFKQGEEARLFYLLVQGRLKVMQVTADGQQLIVRVVNPGDFSASPWRWGARTIPVRRLRWWIAALLPGRWK
ncbi:hypothetical protein BRUCa_2441 [Brucella melitensis]|nr:cyclic nucleotide-binding domain protein [Brucella melitensis bv. 1 str. 16M]AVM32106.1 cyclic nucleotide-binding domain-containing protein [Brucella melitensis]ENQ68545.1 hypothetical protein C962_02582 [Brucella melitensis CNGB 1076]ENQ71577.1 hypothetical protein C963_02585 [Brucella melitensis CNGB 1120]ENQ74452.1 hypothetical protein C964_02580 [Brucella melitensis CNGB 290]ENQ77428.1 hypothetical protein C057_03059 [Brucella melitensis F10/05-2]ENT65956.1 hypothetical protein D627_02